MTKCERPPKPDEAPTLANALFQGGLGYGKICVPTSLTDYILMIVYPPAYVFLYQKREGFNDIGMIVKAFILTSFFYFPGLIFAIFVKNNSKVCGGVFGDL
jgi:uncharacterized membrane protein YqaE (UPF0057 family)